MAQAKASNTLRKWAKGQTAQEELRIEPGATMREGAMDIFRKWIAG